MKTTYKNYEEYLFIKKHKEQLEKKGFIIIPKKKFKILGYFLISVGIITLPLPTGSVFLIILGLGMLGLSLYEIKEKIRKQFFYRVKRRFF